MEGKKYTTFNLYIQKFLFKQIIFLSKKVFNDAWNFGVLHLHFVFSTKCMHFKFAENIIEM